MIEMWKVSRIDAIIWIVTALGVVVLDVSYGLILGLVFVIAILIHKGQHPNLSKLGQIPDTDVYVKSEQYGQVRTVKQVILSVNF